jgi:DinB superfamily
MTAMSRTRIFLLLAVLIFPVVGLRPGTTSAAAGARPAPASQPAFQEQQPAPTVAAVLDREISAVEKEFVGAAEAMPEDKYNFSPERLKIPGSDYKGVRTFAGQVKHVAISNYFIWAPIIGEPVPENLKGDNGGENVKSKADIIKLLKESFALGHKAAATLTTENMLQTAEHSKSTRLRLAMFGVGHVYDHYGQLVEYLRMNGIVPPASRAQSN